MRFRSSNVVINKIFKTDFSTDYTSATYKGVAKKTFYFLFLTVLGAFLGLFSLNALPLIGTAMLVFSSFATFIFALVAFLSPKRTRIFGSLYCVFEGMLVGVISILYNSLSNGIIVSALLATFTVLFVVATLYLTNIVKAGSKFKRFLLTFSISCIISILMINLFTMFTGGVMASPINMLVSVVTTFIAVLYLFFDMEQIKMVVEGGYPEEAEWMASFGLAYTIIWLYIELLRLLVIFASRRD